MPDPGPAPVPTPPLELTADCSRCHALCCVLLPFRREGGFGADKPGGVACHHLQADDRCAIHADLRERGWPGCTVFDCFGAGQQVTEVTYGGASWRDLDSAGDLGEMAAVLSALRRVHEMLVHLQEVARRAPDPAADDLVGRLLALRDSTPVEILTADLDELQDVCGELLAAASRRLRDPAGADLTRADLAGQDLRQRDLRSASLRGALLLGADLRAVRLASADLLGADLRGADLRGADLADVLFLTAPQLAGARTDDTTRVPGHLPRSATGAGG
ncbi:pentapeptide repeat-containing protein [Nocardioides sp.]|uniref:pentapeptide repeat-containing protein n=1 Tax=Nocardioides sp. TaxID=35761 RepID=UPI00262D4A6A|nr:pentapeptide repeat-containing protein [Nocardioides sp.]MDI6908779.1 pentapeptide repeat-containing protein [Nocardioides sp.]